MRRRISDMPSLAGSFRDKVAMSCSVGNVSSRFERSASRDGKAMSETLGCSMTNRGLDADEAVDGCEAWLPVGGAVRRRCGIRRGGDRAPRAMSGPLAKDKAGKEREEPSNSATASSSCQSWEQGRTGSGVELAKGVEKRRTVRATGLMMKSDTNDDIGTHGGVGRASKQKTSMAIHVVEQTSTTGGTCK